LNRHHHDGTKRQNVTNETVMRETEFLTKQFEENRGHMRAVAYRMLGSASEADDAVQEAWVRLNRSDAGAIDNLGGWLTTVVARVCLDALRSRASRREDALETREPMTTPASPSNPEKEALLADSVGIALLIVLDKLNPAERIAFVLHDMFDVSFDEIASIVGRSPASARQLASRARRRVQGAGTPSQHNLQVDLKPQRQVVDAFLTALRARDFEGLMRVLDPQVVVRVDEAASRPGAPREIRGAETWARGAITYAHLAASLELAIIDGSVGLMFAPGGKPARVVKFTIANGRVVAADIIADSARLGELQIVALHQ
jgi:RNA polymerase sigma factor (sigma-70 family)